MPAPMKSLGTKSGVETTADGASFIPASKRADGSTRKEIKIRPGYQPPEDIETYKNRSAEAWKNKGSTGIPGMESVVPGTASVDMRSKNAKRREAARRKAQQGSGEEEELNSAMHYHTLEPHASERGDEQASNQQSELPTIQSDDDVDAQKKVRNLLKKLKGVKDLKDKKANGEKLSPDQLVKIGKESEILRDLQKLQYSEAETPPTNGTNFSFPVQSSSNQSG